jgi:F0F1-type ATP synthase assembly protein I
LIPADLRDRKLSQWGKLGTASIAAKKQTPFLRRAGLYLGIAFELPGTILGGLLVGYLLDKYLGASPWFLIVMGLVGFAGAFLRLVQWGKHFARQRDGSHVKKGDTAH